MSSPSPTFGNKALHYLLKPAVAFPLLILAIALIIYAIPGRQTHPQNGEIVTSADFPSEYGFIPDGKSVILAGHGYAELLDARDGKSLGAIAEDEVLFTWSSPDSTRIAVTTVNGLYLWDIKSSPFARLARLGTSKAPMLRYSPDGTRLLVLEDSTHVASMYNVATGQKVWSNLDPAKPAPAPRPEESQELMEIAFSADGREILLVEGRDVGTSGEDPVRQLNLLRMNALTGKEVAAPLSLPYSQNFQLMNSSGTRILTSQGLALFLWDTATAQPVGEPIICQKADQTMVFSPDDSRLLVEIAPGVVQMRSTQDGKVLGELKLEGVSPEDIFFANFSPDGKYVLTCTSAGIARTWNAVTCAPLCPQISSPKLGPETFTPDGLQLVGKDKNLVQFWDTFGLQKVGEPLDAKGDVEDVNFSKDGTRMLTNGDRQLTRPRLWDMTTRKEIPLKPVSGSGTLDPLFKKRTP